MLVELGDRAAAAAVADEALGAVAEHVGFVRTATFELAVALTELGRGDELIAALGGDAQPWARAATALARNDPLAAADIAAEIGALTYEAHARLRAARLLVERGQRPAAEEQLAAALAFFRSVGARRYIGEAESLFAASA